MSALNGLVRTVRRLLTPAILRTAALTVGLSTLTAAAIIAPQIISGSGAHAKTPGKTYCYNRICHRVLTLAETRRIVGRRTSVVASYYSHCRVDRFNPCGLTSSGAKFRPSRADNAASPIYPNGTKLLVWNPANKRAAVIRIDNAGPYWRNRKLDLSTAAATKLGFRKRGVARLIVQVLSAPTRRQARYRRHRTYAPVAGYIGRFTTMASALQSTGTRLVISNKRIATAKIELPVRNTFLAERRIWLARMAEPRHTAVGPITVAIASAPKVRLPARLIRAGLSPARAARRRNRRQKVAALSGKRKLTRTAKAQKTKRLRKIAAKRKSAPTQKKIAAVSNSKKAKKSKSVGPANASAKRSQQNKKTTIKSAAKPAAAQSKANMAWRENYLGISSNGA